MEKLDGLVAEHLADASAAAGAARGDPRRPSSTAARSASSAAASTSRELNKRAAETDLRLKRLYDAIESGVADLDDPALKERVASLKTIRDQARADADACRSDAGVVSPAIHHARKWSRGSPGRHASGSGSMAAATAAITSVRSPSGSRSRTARSAIIGSKSNLLQTLTAAAGVRSATPGVRSSVRSGGWGGIRTHGGLSPTPVFKTGALNRSATHP